MTVEVALASHAVHVDQAVHADEVVHAVPVLHVLCHDQSALVQQVPEQV